MIDRWNCKHDWEQEQDDLAKLDLHQDGECLPSKCDYCEADNELVSSCCGEPAFVGGDDICSYCREHAHFERRSERL